MIAMRYRIALPADYPMEIIERRIAERGHLTDGLPGLGLKAYLYCRAGEDGAAANVYAPFYLWRTTEGMRDFLPARASPRCAHRSAGRWCKARWHGSARGRTMWRRRATR